ncbi:MAG: WYL domain-containing protein, partial [[Eubacterium] siraeum]|nr:WYL domain-containing protein [[Eubacterium] siraeum]
MKIDRIIGIIDFMQQNGKTTMPRLAEMFHVSRRTICRDIDVICSSGIPIVTSQGVDGGIELVKGYYFDTKGFTKDELHAIFSGARAIEKPSEPSDNLNCAKYSAGNDAIPLSDNVVIDISSIYRENIAPKILALKNAIRFNQYVSFLYYAVNGESLITVQPRMIVFRRSNWYLLGFCGEKNDYFFYKFNNLWNLQLLQQKFVSGEIPADKLNFSEEVSGG